MDNSVYLKIPVDVDVKYIINNVYIFNYGDILLLGVFLKTEDDYNIFKSNLSAYKHILDSKIILNKHIVKIFKKENKTEVLKQSLFFKDIIVDGV